MQRAALSNTNIGAYRITDFLGAGGMGEVWRAVHTGSGEVVAIKLLLAQPHAARSDERFLQEAQVQAQLRHPNIAAFHRLMQFQNHPCIVMEYVDGQTLSNRIRFHGLLSVPEALNVLQAVGSAVAHMHSQGIIHRDLKSNNIKITSQGTIKLLDFGIARSLAAPHLTQTGIVVGALESLSPEQVSTGHADERSDIWALGVLLYEMLTGQVPFAAHNISESLARLSAGNYTAASALNPDVPRKVESIIARCLKKNPADRFPSVNALLDEISRVTASPGNTNADSSSLPGWLANVPRWQKEALALAAVLALLVYFGLPQTPVSGPVKKVRIGTTEGRAEVWRDNHYLGNTPLQIEAAPGEQLRLLLKRDGYREKSTTVQVSEGNNEYHYTLEKIDLVNR